jgi:TonB family protein
MHQLLSAAITAAFLSNPVAVASARPASCSVDYRPASIVRSVAPEYPEIAKVQGVTGTSVIRVDLSETGAVLGASLAVSSGSSVLDRVAIGTVRSMAYAPEQRSCIPIAGSYAVRVEFTD